MAAAERQMDFRELIAEVIRRVDDYTLESIKYQCRDRIGPGRLERIDTAQNLFKTLEEMDEINHEEVQFLHRILTNVDRIDLAKLVLKFSEKWGLSQATSKAKHAPDVVWAAEDEPPAVIGNSSTPTGGKVFANEDAKERSKILVSSHQEPNPGNNRSVPFATEGYALPRYPVNHGGMEPVRQRVEQPIPAEVSTALEYVISTISRGWQSAARHLGVPDAIIDNAEDNWPRNVRNQIRQAFMHWARNGPDVTVLHLIEAMRHVGRNDIADELEYG